MHIYQHWCAATCAFLFTNIVLLWSNVARLIQKLLSLWLILKSILICLRIGKLLCRLNLELQRQGTVNVANMLWYTDFTWCKFIHIFYCKFFHVKDFSQDVIWSSHGLSTCIAIIKCCLLIVYVGVFILLQRSTWNMLIKHTWPLWRLSGTCKWMKRTCKWMKSSPVKMETQCMR